MSNSISLLVATLDLELVRLLRAAMNTDVTGGRGHAAAGAGPAASQANRTIKIQPQTKILPRKHIHPEPRIEPRPVIRPADRFESSDCVPAPTPCYKPTASPIQPPWKVLPWEQPMDCRPRTEVKVVVRPPDIIHKGSLLDFFI